MLKQLKLIVVSIICLCGVWPNIVKAQTKKPLIVFVTGDHEYSSELTMPLIAAELEKSYGMLTVVLKSSPDQNAEENIPGLEILRKADVAIFFLRWRRLPASQIKYIDEYLRSGKPVMGFRTATHSFNYPAGDQLENWNSFGEFALNAPPGWERKGNHTHYGHKSTTAVSVIPAEVKNPVLNGVARSFRVPSWLYRVLPDYPVKGSVWLLMGHSINLDKPATDNPVAWTGKNSFGGKVFMTTLGHPEDFNEEAFQHVVINAVHWAAGKPVPVKWAGKIVMNIRYDQHLNLFVANKASAQTPAANKETEIRRLIKQYVEEQGKVKWISQAVISPNGKYVAWAADGLPGNSTHAIYYAAIASPDIAVRITAAAANEWAYETEPRWSPDSREIAFISDAQNGHNQVFAASIVSASVKPQALTKFDGYISHLKWSGNGQYLSVLYVEKASREPSPMAAENRRVGVIDSLANKDIQRIAVINRATKETTLATPADKYVFEYDWSPDATQVAYTAATPPGDDNWYIAKLYKQSVAKQDAAIVYRPALQIALPKWSPDGKQIAFIEGLMSDQGGTGGEIFTVMADGSALPVNLTPGRKSTPSWFTWRPDGDILFTEFVGGSTAITTLNTTRRNTQTVWKGDETIQATAEATSVSVTGQTRSPVLALIRTSFSMLPEVWAGTINELKQVTHLNTTTNFASSKAQHIEWISENQQVQGWLLFPAGYDATKHYPLLVAVHGGPAWISTPAWSAPDFNTTLYARLGYFVFFPNPRGSHGQGEKFTQNNRRDWGFGDLRDIISGVDTLISRFPIDKGRVGMLGWSYGGFMSMFAGTQTNRFSAVVAGAGASDWLSYYGQNFIDKWMMPYFGASPYDDPAAYAKSSAMTYIKQSRTPALILVGERDGEAPAPQSFQYWHALKELNVPTQLVVYPDEGHSFYKPENLLDVTLRTIEWFNRYMPVE